MLRVSLVFHTIVLSYWTISLVTANIEMNIKQVLNVLSSLKKCIDSGIISGLKTMPQWS